MYFVDRIKIEQMLRFLEAQLARFEEKQDWNQDEFTQLALERMVQISIDSVLDVGNAMIDGFIMRDPGSYEDIIDILLDEKVITNEIATQFKNVLPLRKMLVQDYIEVSQEQLQSVFYANKSAFTQYPELIRSYLTNELGPVSAFKN